ncbi:hypothetical protein [Paracoccus sulfuroxidans]|uniref:Uncharacterized protein n=1 Tax=Paracoccus sulfuroxidans TaxID=384678 RepID=A0A562NRT4_9RHOB|nr:hypothetical protein [Paracoccus sulfuroxidans]TWI34912.1 hypothetical protein IQ24_01420 [Paracoccus sulfuroxidans]
MTHHCDLAARQQDMRDLSILRRACTGEKFSDISRSHGKGGAFARVLVARIRDADLRESGEPQSVVLAGYPGARS